MGMIPPRPQTKEQVETSQRDVGIHMLPADSTDAAAVIKAGINELKVTEEEQTMKFK